VGKSPTNHPSVLKEIVFGVGFEISRTVKARVFKIKQSLYPAFPVFPV